MILQNHRLQVHFSDPSQLQTRRFDHTAVAEQVVLDGKYVFCTPEQVLPGRRTTCGKGLCGEFVLSGAAEKTEAGQWFLKPGVGLLRQPKDGMPYDMWQKYDMQPFPVTAKKEGNRAVFTQQAAARGGYALDIQKIFTLQDNRLILEIHVTNSGDTEMALQEYQHNFVSLNGIGAGPGYILELGCDKLLPQIVGCTLRQGDEATLPSAVRAEGSNVIWEDDLSSKVLYHRCEDIDPNAPYRWTLRRRDLSISVSEETDFCPSRIDLWAVEHCICPEFYHAVRLAPGESAHWRRTWTFCP